MSNTIDAETQRVLAMIKDSALMKEMIDKQDAQNLERRARLLAELNEAEARHKLELAKLDKVHQAANSASAAAEREYERLSYQTRMAYGSILQIQCAHSITVNRLRDSLQQSADPRLSRFYFELSLLVNKAEGARRTVELSSGGDFSPFLVRTYESNGKIVDRLREAAKRAQAEINDMVFAVLSTDEITQRLEAMITACTPEAKELGLLLQDLKDAAKPA